MSSSATLKKIEWDRLFFFIVLSSCLGQEVIITDPVFKFVSWAENINVAPTWEFASGAGGRRLTIWVVWEGSKPPAQTLPGVREAAAIPIAKAEERRPSVYDEPGPDANVNRTSIAAN